MDIILPLVTLLVGVIAGAFGVLLVRRDHAPAADPSADQTLIRDGLDRLHDKMRDLEHQRVSWQSTLHQQVDEVRHSTDTLRRETSALATALRKPQVRGQWGELHLRRSIELAGMVDRCDFSQQVHLPGEDGALRPDVVIHLAGGKSIVVDAKVPLAGYLDAIGTEDPEEQQAHLAVHARQLRTHVDQLSSKAYWRALGQHGIATPEFVVLFLPAESFLSAALEAEPRLLEYAAARNIVLATPTTLIALLRTVAHGWTTETLAQRTREIHQLGRDLYGRLGTVGRHLDKLGRSLKSSVESYNSAVGSLENRVLVTARHFSDVADLDEELTAPRPVEEAPRPLTAVELLDAVADRRPELPEVEGPGSGVAPLQRRVADLR
ncbi:DNA recombination protein RmuC [Nocardioides marmoriginsengisoli]|uniref:DNA recombination protein RmuC n=1 Tax=Nocardioides marmoriginsengisoli TaxID=661483 RepID=A0A3N0CEA9_9ACTN|nr:DNA recombination protein RmuC [Nocardioides marmoriginsengisoli]RNL61343.1 DNA recombination protein RmuC [Nocardioides marmoriginsengisoli]